MSQQSLCDPNRIEKFLRHELDESSQVSFEDHLGDCIQCRHQLEASAASAEIWRGVRDSLQSIDKSDLDTPVDEPDSYGHESVVALLAPTDDERMIGRLGNYEIAGVIGSGGMGVVLKALDPSLNRYVAIKVLSPHLATSAAARMRFSREAQAAAAVMHDNVVEIHGVSEHVGRSTGIPYLVMPYVKGPSLQRRIDDDGPLTLVEILRIAKQTADGLSAAHEQGLVHRDVKPANILLADGIERVKLTDFGLARAADDASLTRTGIIAGTPQYMSPEQARGEAVDERSDLFSLGSVIYAMCTGRPPFRAESSYGVLRSITDDTPARPSEVNRDIPPLLCNIVTKLMEKNPECRFQSAAEVADLLGRYLAHVQHPSAIPPPTMKLSRTSNKSNQFGPTIHRLKGVLIMLGAFGLGVLGMFLWQGGEAPDISGNWSGEGWGNVVLTQSKPGVYSGTYTDTFGIKPGKIKLKWSRIEQRYKGTWGETDDRFGKISVRPIGAEVRGAWTTSKKSKIDPGVPKLADLAWNRPPSNDATSEKLNENVLDNIQSHTPPNGKTIAGTVKDKSSDNLVVISIGHKHGLTTKIDLIVFRGNQQIATIRPIKIQANESVARVSDRRGGKELEIGDFVTGNTTSNSLARVELGSTGDLDIHYQQKVEAAERAFEIQTAFGSAPTEINQALMLMRVSKYSEAIEILESAIASKCQLPTRVIASVYKAKCSESLGRIDDAIKTCDFVLAVEGDFAIYNAARQEAQTIKDRCLKATSESNKNSALTKPTQ